MRAFALLVMLTACASTDAAGPVSMHDRLSAETHLFVTTGDRAGAVTAQLRTATGWEDAVVDLQLAGGELVTRAAPGGAIAVTAVQLELQTIAIPATLTGHEAALTRPRLELIAPAAAVATWLGEDSAELEVDLALQLSWALTVDGVGIQVGAPKLPPLPVVLRLTGDGARVTADVHIHAAGELWSWANLVKLSDLELVLGAGTPPPPPPPVSERR
jgi:hypothetical protein